MMKWPGDLVSLGHRWRDLFRTDEFAKLAVHHPVAWCLGSSAVAALVLSLRSVSAGLIAGGTVMIINVYLWRPGGRERSKHEDRDARPKRWAHTNPLTPGASESLATPVPLCGEIPMPGEMSGCRLLGVTALMGCLIARPSLARPSVASTVAVGTLMKVPLLMGCVAVVGAIALASIVWSLAAMNRRRTAGLVAALYGLALTYLSVILALFAVNGPFCNPLDQPCPEYRMGIVDVVPVAVAGILALVCFGVAVRVWIRPRNDRRPGAYRHLGEGVAR